MTRLVTHHPRLRGIHAVLFMGICNAIGQALVFEIRKDVPVFWIIAIQSLIGCLVVILISFKEGNITQLSQTLALRPRDWMLLNLRALVCSVGGLGLIYWSYAYLPLSVASWFMAVPLASFWAYFLLGERISSNDRVALALSIVGLLILSTGKTNDETTTHFLGILLITFGIFIFSFGWVLSKKIIGIFGERNFTILSNAAIGFYSLTIASLFFELPELDTSTYILLALRGIVLGVVTILFARTLRCLRVTRGLVIARLENVYIVMIGFFVFGEEISVYVIVGGCLLLASSLVAGRS